MLIFTLCELHSNWATLECGKDSRCVWVNLKFLQTRSLFVVQLWWISLSNKLTHTEWAQRQRVNYCETFQKISLLALNGATKHSFSLSQPASPKHSFELFLVRALALFSARNMLNAVSLKLNSLINLIWMQNAFFPLNFFHLSSFVFCIQHCFSLVRSSQPARSGEHLIHQISRLSTAFFLVFWFRVLFLSLS